MLFQLQQYIKYKVCAVHKKGHGVHSPFVFDLIINVLNDTTQYQEYAEIEQLINKLKNDKRLITHSTYGAVIPISAEVKLSSLVKQASVNKKYGRLLFRLVRYYQLQTILELGTCVGVSSLYMAKANPTAKVITLEGCESYANIASELFTEAKLVNVIQKIGDFSETLSDLSLPKLDFVFFDGNHTYQATVDYFNILLNQKHSQTIFVFDDIYWSKEMFEAWKYISSHNEVKLSIDLYRMGLVFFTDKILEKQHFRIRF